jgi:hypothetical protein
MYFGSSISSVYKFSVLSLGATVRPKAKAEEFIRWAYDRLTYIHERPVLHVPSRDQIVNTLVRPELQQSMMFVRGKAIPGE